MRTKISPRRHRGAEKTAGTAAFPITRSRAITCDHGDHPIPPILRASVVELGFVYTSVHGPAHWHLGMVVSNVEAGFFPGQASLQTLSGVLFHAVECRGVEWHFSPHAHGQCYRRMGGQHHA